MRTFAFFLVTILFGMSILFGQELSFPNYFVVRYLEKSSGSTYYIDTKNGKPIGKVIREKKDDKAIFSFFSLDNQLLAYSQTAAQSKDTVVNVFNYAGEKIGWFVSDSSTNRQYKVYNQNNQCIGKGGMNWIGNRFTLTAPDNAHLELITFHRPFFRMVVDNWHATIHRPDKIDYRIDVLIGAFQAYINVKAFEKLKT